MTPNLFVAALLAVGSFILGAIAQPREASLFMLFAAVWLQLHSMDRRKADR